MHGQPPQSEVTNPALFWLPGQDVVLHLYFISFIQYNRMECSPRYIKSRSEDCACEEMFYLV